MRADLEYFEIDEKEYIPSDVELLTIKDASDWASEYLKKRVTISNVSYLIQYGRIKKYEVGGNVFIDKKELKDYYDSTDVNKKFKKLFGSDVNWHLSFHEYKESERTKHVHRLHPYKGKFIPQLVEYFLDSHVDEFKKKVYFKEGDIVLDPFCGSGTTLVQSNELGIHAIGIDISSFNVMISEVKVEKHNLEKIKDKVDELTRKLKKFQKNRNNLEFENVLLRELTTFNNRFFPSPDYKRNIKQGIIDENLYSAEKEREFLNIYKELILRYNIDISMDYNNSFLSKWYLKPVREELEYLVSEIKLIEDLDLQKTLSVILSRTARSCRATTHADLATLKAPVYTTYYCKKHGKICKPIFSILKWWEFYTKDTVKRIEEFNSLRSDTYQLCILGDSRTVDLYWELERKNYDFFEMVKKQKIKGVFTSPPYVGLIDYHEQHAYAYELLGLERRDELEIGPLYKGQGERQRASYVDGISMVLLNIKKYLQKDYDIFIVANDKYNLYPKIAEISGMKIVNRFKRPVLNRVEKDRDTPFSETIFHLKER